MEANDTTSDCDEQGEDPPPLFQDYDIADEGFEIMDDLWDCHLQGEEREIYLSPSTEKWEDYLPTSGMAKITIDQSKLVQWDRAKEEIRHVRKRLKIMILGEDHELDDLEQVSIPQIAGHFVGSNSRIGKTLREELDLSKEDYLKFMATLCIQASYKVSVAQLYNKHSKLKESTAMEERDYKLIWKKMATKKRLESSRIDNSRRETCIWQILERDVNKNLREISIQDREGRIGIALDDDKIWMQQKNAKVNDLFGLKYSTHVRPNRKGLIAHTAVSTGCTVPLCIVFEKTKDSTITCFKRLLSSLFDSNGETDLSNVDVGSDRAYMLPNIVFEYLIQLGADFVGTIKRSAHCWPFTFNQKLSDNDQRTLIDCKGAPTLFLKFVRVGAKRVWVSAFRNGTESVATAVSSLHRGHHWEGIALLPHELLKYRADNMSLLSSFFQRVPDMFELETAEELVLLSVLLELVIDALTLRQATADWHYMRKFSFTSSQGHGAFLAALPAYQDDERWIEVAVHIYGEDWKEVLKIPPPAGQGGTGNGTDDGSSDNEEEQEQVIIPLSQYLENLEPALNDGQAFNALDLLQQFVHNHGVYNEDEYESDDDERRNVSGPGMVVNGKERAAKLMNQEFKPTIKRAIQILQGRIEESKLSNRKNAEFEKFLMSPNSVREYLFYSRKALEDMLKVRSIKLKRGVRISVNKLVDVLAGLSDNDIDTTPPATANLIADVGDLTPADAALKSVLTKSFLPHQKGEKREYCTLGHRLELPILHAFCKQTSKIDFPCRDLKVKGGYTAGLAGKKGCRHAKDSIDFVITVNDNSEDTVLWGFEAKGRVTMNTAAHEVEFMDAIGREEHIRIDDTEVYAMIDRPSERFQILQHAFVYDFDTVVLAIANKGGTLISSTIVDYSPQLKNSFEHVLNDLKDITLSWAYDGWNNNLPIEIPDRALQIAGTVKTINGGETLQGALHVWKTLCKLPSPIPSFARLIPAICAYWNATKSGSDTTTKLLDDRAVYMPYVNCETVACTRLIMLMFVVCHRLSQIATSSVHLPYPTLEHYRNAASKRMTYHVTLLNCESYFRQELKNLKPPSSLLQSPNRTQNQSNRRSNPSRIRFGGTVPQPMSFAATLSSKTPKKMTKKASSGQVTDEVKKMVSTCTGIPLKLIGGETVRCNDPGCNQKTRWYCAGCKRFLCNDRKFSAKQSTGSDPLPQGVEVYCHEVSGNMKQFAKLCFHKHHQAAWDRAKEGAH